MSLHVIMSGIIYKIETKFTGAIIMGEAQYKTETWGLAYSEDPYDDDVLVAEGRVSDWTLQPTGYAGTYTIATGNILLGPSNDGALIIDHESTAERLSDEAFQYHIKYHSTDEHGDRFEIVNVSCGTHLCPEDTEHWSDELMPRLNRCNCTFLFQGQGSTAPCQWDAYCGDNVVQPIEACDDGNNENGDGCSGDCKMSSRPIIDAVTSPEEATVGNLKIVVDAHPVDTSAEIVSYHVFLEDEGIDETFTTHTFTIKPAQRGQKTLSIRVEDSNGLVSESATLTAWVYDQDEDPTLSGIEVPLNDLEPEFEPTTVSYVASAYEGELDFALSAQGERRA